MGAPLLAYVQNIVQNIVQKARVCVSGLLVMCGSTASARGLLLRDCWRGACSAASFIWEGKGCAFWIGTADLDRKR